MENIKLLLYCCKDKRGYLHFDTRPEITKKYYLSPDSSPFGTYEPDNYLNGKILAECDYEVEEIAIHRTDVGVGFDTTYYTENMEGDELIQLSCVDNQEMQNYFGISKNNGEIVGNAIHIKNLKERIMELSDCHSKKTFYKYGCYCTEYNPATKAPQNMMRVWVYENGKWVMYILISIRPEWMCLILNKDKTIEIRKRVLKEMIDNVL